MIRPPLPRHNATDHGHCARASEISVYFSDVRNYVIKAEVAANNVEREQGLMFREKLGPNEGMVFLFEGAAIWPWMKNTLIPLSVAFLDESNT